jgi:hypothetical protein
MTDTNTNINNDINTNINNEESSGDIFIINKEKTSRIKNNSYIDSKDKTLYINSKEVRSTIGGKTPTNKIQNSIDLMINGMYGTAGELQYIFHGEDEIYGIFINSKKINNIINNDKEISTQAYERTKFGDKEEQEEQWFNHFSINNVVLIDDDDNISTKSRIESINNYKSYDGLNHGLNSKFNVINNKVVIGEPMICPI